LRVRWLAVLGCIFAALVLGLTACGGDDDEEEGGAAGEELTIYSSLPLQGASRPQTTALVNGAKLALKQAGNKVGNFSITYKSLDDSTAQAGSWTPEATSANARRAAQDDSTIVYLGEFNSGASAISIPILNEAGIPQISPANTYVGLTTDKPGSERGEPDKFYPTGKRTYARIPPADDIQAAALVTLMQKEGCQNTYMTNDK
jgi:branched-chain amino acid transport system substrate-binding protein